MDFIVRALPFGREPDDGAISDIGCEAASDEGAYQTSPTLGKPPPTTLRPHFDPPNGGFQGAIVGLIVELRNAFGEMTVDAAAPQLVGQPVGTPPAIDRTILDETLCETLIVEEVELIEPLESLVDVVVFEPFATELLNQLGAEMIPTSNQLQSFVISRIFHCGSCVSS